MKRSDCLYQWRLMPGETADDLLSELTHAAWSGLTGAPGERGLDPHRWTDLHAFLRDVFKGRLVHYKGCGEREECRTGLVSAVGDRHFPAEEWGLGAPTLTLEFGRPMDRLARLLGALACRRLGIRLPARRSVSPGVGESLRKVFERRLYRSDACAGCSARKGFRERRLWPKEILKGACHDSSLENPGGD